MILSNDSLVAFHYRSYGTFFYTKIGSIISIGDLPTTNIIEPLFNDSSSPKEKTSWSSLFLYIDQKTSINLYGCLSIYRIEWLLSWTPKVRQKKSSFWDAVHSIFDWAEELEYIEANKVAKILRRIKATKKIQLAESKREEDLYLTHEQLQEWFSAFQEDLDNDKITLKDYVLFYLTFFLGDRKSETYALQWKHIDFSKSQIQLIQALDRYGQVKSTKGNKKTIFSISNDLLQLLTSWKEQQRYELAKFGIISNPEQFVFTYIDTKGNINKPLHADYLNNKMKSIRKRHKELAHATPHKLRHTGATLAKQAGMSLEAISEALTHSDTGTTQIYVNTSNVVPMAVGEFALKSLKQ